MKLKVYAWKLMLIFLFLISYIFLVIQFPSNTSYYYLFNISLFFLLVTLILVIKPKWDLFVLSCIIIFLSLYTLGQSIYLRAFGQLAYFNTALSLKNEAFNSLSSILEFFKIGDLKYIFFPLLFFILSITTRKLEITSKFKKKYLIFTLIGTFVTSIILFNLCLNSIESSRTLEEDFFYYKTDHYLFYSKPSSVLFVEKFGLNLWLFKDLYDSYAYPLVNSNETKNDEISEYLSLISDDKSSSFNGIFKDKSLMLIEAESLNNYAIDPILTPTLYKLFTNGYKFPNYNSPLLLGSTSDAELMVNTGLLPPDNGYITFLKYFDNTFPTTLANEFNEENYYSIASHNNYGEFYNRDVVYPNFGYTFYDCIDMGFDTQFIEDSKYIEVLTWILIEKPKFLSYWITFNGHQPYNVEEFSERINLHLATVKEKYPDIPYEEQVYLAKNMDLDEGLAYMIEVFTYMNRIDDLVIIIYGDHAPKGIFENGLNESKNCSSIGYSDEQCLNTPLIIWNKDEFVGESLIVSNPTDISPTIYDLFGIEYNHENVFGNSVFSNNYSGYYFDANGNIKTNQFSYNSETNSISNSDILESNDWNLKLKQYKEKMNIYQNIIEIDYFGQ